MNKKLIVLALTLTMPVIAVAAADKVDHAEGWHVHRVEHLTKELGLSPEQKTKVEALFKEQEDKFKSIHEETQTRLKGLLSEEQNKKLDELRKRRHDKWQKK